MIPLGLLIARLKACPPIVLHAMQETDRPIQRENVYYDSVTDLYVVINDIWVAEDGEVQVSVRQYTDTPIRAHTSAGYTDEYDARRALTKNDVRKRILSGELEYRDEPLVHKEG